jgi:hypothetical protein
MLTMNRFAHQSERAHSSILKCCEQFKLWNSDEQDDEAGQEAKVTPANTFPSKWRGSLVGDDVSM